MAEGGQKIELPKPDTQQAPQEQTKAGGKFKIEKIPGALSKAFEKMKGAKGFAKLTVFFETFWNETHEIEQEKKEVSEAAKAEATKSVEDQMKTAKEAAKLDDKTPDADKQFYDEILAMAVTAGKELPLEMQTGFISARDKLSKAVKGETPEDSTLDEVKAISAAGLLTVTKLKAKYNDPAKFKEALDKLDRISDASAYPLKKLLSMPVLKIFRLKLDIAGEGLQGLGAALGVSEKGEGMKLLDSFNLSMGDAMKLKGLKEQPIKDENDVVAVIKKSILPNTDEAKIRNVAKTINKMMVEKPDHIDTQTLTDIVFNVDDRDMKRLIEILTGKKAEIATKAA